MQRTFTWQGIDDPQRIDVASVIVSGADFRAHGSQHAADHSLAWSLECRDWITTSMRVASFASGVRRDLELTRDTTGRWTTHGRVDGAVVDPGVAGAPGIADPGLLDAAVDCDLGLCPLTNVMPGRRLGLLDAPSQEHVLTMAWIDLPSLQVIPSVQRYTGLGQGRVRYESEQRDFRSDLSIDADGFVIDYPQLAQRIELRA